MRNEFHCSLKPINTFTQGDNGVSAEVQAKNEEEISKEDVNIWKKSISETISLLRN